MAQIRKLEGQIELNCSAEKLFKMNMVKQANIPNICANMCKVEAYQGDWESVGSTRRWDYVIGIVPFFLSLIVFLLFVQLLIVNEGNNEIN